MKWFFDFAIVVFGQMLNFVHLNMCIIYIMLHVWLFSKDRCVLVLQSQNWKGKLLDGNFNNNNKKKKKTFPEVVTHCWNH